MAIRGTATDKERITLDGLNIKNCDVYNYLGVNFTQDGKITTALKTHAAEKQKQLMKLSQYVFKNKDHPIAAKSKVLRSAFNSAILYGMESWLSCNLSTMNTIQCT